MDDIKKSGQSIDSLLVLSSIMDDGTKKALEAAGVVFRGLVMDNPQLGYVDLPEGWKMVTKYAPYIGFLRDEKGRFRATVYAYSNYCCIKANRRFTIYVKNGECNGQMKIWAEVADANGDYVIHFTKRIDEPIGDFTPAMRIAIEDLVRAEGAAWLCKMGYPEHEKFDAYWNDERA